MKEKNYSQDEGHRSLLKKQEIIKKQKEIEALEEDIKFKEMLPHVWGKPHYKWSREFYESKNPEAFICAANQIGKANLLDCPIPTPSGFKLMGEILVGDTVFSREGKPCLVVDIPFIGEDEFFEVEFSDGDSVSVSQNHEWIAKGYKERFRKKYKVGRGDNKCAEFVNDDFGAWKVFSTKEMFEKSYSKGKSSPAKRFSIPCAEAVEYEEKELFSPYYLGLFLGNGSQGSITFNKEDEDLVSYCSGYGNLRSKTGVVGINSKTIETLFKLGVYVNSYDKHIPTEYLFGSIFQRKLLLAGLLDTDGYTSGVSVEYSTTSDKLALGVKELVNSLGGLAQIKKKEDPFYRDKNGEKVFCRDCFRISIWTPFNPFISDRKKSVWKENTRYKHERVITKITPIGKRKGKCISVSSEDSSYLCGKEYIVTHNSSVLIRTCVEWATNKDLWPELWPGKVPNLFWYFYPDYRTATEEFYTKWKEWLPRGELKNNATYGWKEEINKKEIQAIVFFSGIRVIFKCYSQKDSNIQASSVYATFLDEECPISKLPEIMVRLSATGGFLRSGFTATIGQDYWRRVLEPQGTDEELHPDAWKKQISLYDCMTYEDGSPGPWTPDKIKKAIARCGSRTEELRRVWGKFVVSGGLRYESFDREKCVVHPHPLPSSWGIYVGIDFGSGGERGHPSAIVFVGVSPDGKSARVFKCWRGDGMITTASDVVNKYIEMKGNLLPTVVAYDYSAKDLHTYAQARGHALTKADKSVDTGITTLNTLFRNEMLKIQAGDLEREKLIVEMTSVLKVTSKTMAKDDLCDALKYAVCFVPWNWEAVDEFVDSKPLEGDLLLDKVLVPETESERRMRERLGKTRKDEVDTIELEMEAWNELYEC